MTSDEYRKIFRSLGKNIYWVTISGGEPFLRTDLPEIVDALCEEASPGVINIPTNGILQSQIKQLLPRILKKTQGKQVTLNFSLDDIGKRHDEIRRTPNNWEKTLESIAFTKSLQSEYPHLTVGIHTVISVHNIARFPAIYDELQKLSPDSYITEVAEERAELLTIDAGITPSPDKYAEVADFMINRICSKQRHGFASIIDGFRLEYYTLAKKILAGKRQAIPCYAGSASCHIAPDGDVWGCCIRAESLGNLRDVDHDFNRIWQSALARNFRKSVKNKECACPLANAAYTNMLMDPLTMMRVGWNLVFPKTAVSKKNINASTVDKVSL
jgi:MoaA/NifB/PqqE/SkfB family radical SAM enzyme